MEHLETLVWVTLAGLSVLAVGNLISVIAVFVEQRNTAAEELELATAVNDRLRRLHRRLQAAPDKAAEVSEQLSELRAQYCLELDGLIAGAIDLEPMESLSATLALTAAQEVRWLRQVSGLVIKTAPLVGMMGTLIGLKTMFAAMGGVEAGDMGRLFAAFGFCLSTTLAGAAISALGLLAQKIFLDGGLDLRVRTLLTALRESRLLSREIRMLVELTTQSTGPVLSRENDWSAGELPDYELTTP